MVDEPEKPKSPLKIFAVRLPPEIGKRVEDVAVGLGLAEAVLLRAVILECLPVYERRVERIKAGLRPDDANPKKEE